LAYTTGISSLAYTLSGTVTCTLNNGDTLCQSPGGATQVLPADTHFTVLQIMPAVGNTPANWNITGYLTCQ
jgi:hypothetical protein